MIKNNVREYDILLVLTSAKCCAAGNSKTVKVEQEGLLVLGGSNLNFKSALFILVLLAVGVVAIVSAAI